MEFGLRRAMIPGSAARCNNFLLDLRRLDHIEMIKSLRAAARISNTGYGWRPPRLDHLLMGHGRQVCTKRNEVSVRAYKGNGLVDGWETVSRIFFCPAPQGTATIDRIMEVRDSGPGPAPASRTPAAQRALAALLGGAVIWLTVHAALHGSLALRRGAATDAPTPSRLD